MASRRTRIKGIANIPQRRKPGGNTNLDEHVKSVPEIDKNQEVNDEHNLTLSEKDTVAHIETENQQSLNGQQQDLCEIDTKQICEGPKTTTSENTKTADEIIAPVVNKDVKKDEHKDPILPTRRRFMKPTVAINAINRKAKDGSDDKKPVAPAAPQNFVKPSNGKIIILNEIITYPNQREQIIVHNVAQYKQNESDPKIQVDSQNNNTQPENVELKTQAPEEENRELPPSNSVPIVNPEAEYPVPPASPTKINRSRIKAIPRLGQRYHSFSASESEDESRRNYRHRNDSVCSTASAIPDNNSISDCPSPQKPKEFNSVIQRKCRRTEQARKLAEARRDFYSKFGNDKPDRQKLTMMDLIFYNPTTNLMSHGKHKNDGVVEENVNKDEIRSEETEDDPKASDEENEIPAPQIKIGPKGEIVLDEQSLVIENKAVKKGREEIQKSELVNGDFDTGYGIYKRAKRARDWSKAETLKFYKALNTIGTDFTLMCELFPRRSRRELKMKFKKEERINRNLVDKAIMQPCGFDFEDFKHEVEMEEQEQQELEKQREREQELKKEMANARKRKNSLSIETEPPQKIEKLIEKPKKRTKKIKKFDILNVLDDDDDSDADVSEDDDWFEKEDSILQSIQKPTRSGRVPKILDRYRAPAIKNCEEKFQTANETQPGSLMVVASTGPNGEPVYKVFMATGEQSKQQISDDAGSLSKAMELRGLQNILTLSTSDQREDTNNDTTCGEETNITIPADENINIPDKTQSAKSLEAL